MRVTYNVVADAAYIHLVDEIGGGGVAETRTCEPVTASMINLDFDDQGRLLGIEVWLRAPRCPPSSCRRAHLRRPPPHAPPTDTNLGRPTRDRHELGTPTRNPGSHTTGSRPTSACRKPLGLSCPTGLTYSFSARRAPRLSARCRRASATVRRRGGRRPAEVSCLGLPQHLDRGIAVRRGWGTRALSGYRVCFDPVGKSGAARQMVDQDAVGHHRPQTAPVPRWQPADVLDPCAQASAPRSRDASVPLDVTGRR